MKKVITAVLLAMVVCCYSYGQHRSFVDVEDSAIVFHNEITIKPRYELSTSKEALGREDAFFEVVDAEDASLVGKKVIAKVVYLQKSNMSGAGAILSMLPLYIDNDGTAVELLPVELHFRGLNRSNVKIFTCFTIVSLFIPGGGVKVSTSERFKARINTK